MFPSSDGTTKNLVTWLFEEPLVPLAEPDPLDTAALTSALVAYEKRTQPDDVSALSAFLDSYPESTWRAALLTELATEYYKSGRFSKALRAWERAWTLTQPISVGAGVVLGSRVAGELAYMYGRLGRRDDLERLLDGVEGRGFMGASTERITGAKEGLWEMRNHPETSFRCGPLAVNRLRLLMDPECQGEELIHDANSTDHGTSLTHLAELSRSLGFELQMVFREATAPLIVPCVAHLAVDHYVAIVRRDGDKYVLEDSTFGNDTWATSDALDEETSGYFLVRPGEVPAGWRLVDAAEGLTVWGKGRTTGNDDMPHGPCDPATPGGSSCPTDDCKGMAVPRVHLMLVSLNINDDPVGYIPPVGPPVRFMVRYNQREAHQPSTFTYSNLGSKWTFDWLSYITDNPNSPSATVSHYMMGGGTRVFEGFDAALGSYAPQQFDQTKLTRTAPDEYHMLARDGSLKIFAKSDGSPAGSTSRKVFLTQVVDPAGNAVTLGYDTLLRLMTITDVIGQVTRLRYELPSDQYKITKVIDPFGRYATFEYDAAGRLTAITDVIGIVSEFAYEVAAPGQLSDFVTSLTTPYGITTFTKGSPGNTRRLETLYPDGNRDRVEYNQSPDPGGPSTVPTGMGASAEFLYVRNTYYWSKQAYASAYPDYTKAKIFHWLHTSQGSSITSGILESVKDPLEGRIFYDYAGQSHGNRGSIDAGITNQPSHVGRILDDGSTQLYTYEYNTLGNITKQIDPVGRTFSFDYAANGTDVLAIRQTRSGKDELISRTTYNSQHLPVNIIDAAGQATSFTYNARGQPVTITDAKGGRLSYRYDEDGHRVGMNGPLPSMADIVTWTYDSVGRVRKTTFELGYSLTFDYDDLDRITKITFPDGTSGESAYVWLDLAQVRDRAGRETTFDHNSVRQVTKRTDPLGRETHLEWCRCGALRKLTDPMGRTTSWVHDIQGRVTSRLYVDGSAVRYLYEDATSRLMQRIDQSLQVTQYDYSRDNNLRRISYSGAIVDTHAISFGYDQDYDRLAHMTDATGTTYYDYYPVTATPALGAGRLAKAHGPQPGHDKDFTYDELGRTLTTAVDAVTSAVTYDVAGRLVTDLNQLGSFSSTYDGPSFRVSSELLPNGQIAEFAYSSVNQDRSLQRISNRVGVVPISEFTYDRDSPTGQITKWSRQSGAETPVLQDLSYDLADQLSLGVVSEAGLPTGTFKYTYDADGNRLTEELDGSTRQYTYNALNELTSASPDPRSPAIYKWDAEGRLASVQADNTLTQFDYDGFGRRIGIRALVGGAEVSNQRYVWCGSEIREERSATGSVVKRYFTHGMKVESGPETGAYFYARDHLGSVRELVDQTGTVRARYTYEPFGGRNKIAGDVDADLGFAGMPYHHGTALSLAWFRPYDPVVGRWLSRDPLASAELLQGPNLYVYAQNDPVNRTDPTGLVSWGDWMRAAALILKLFQTKPETMPPGHPNKPQPTEPVPRPPNPVEPPPRPPVPPQPQVPTSPEPPLPANPEPSPPSSKPKLIPPVPEGPCFLLIFFGDIHKFQCRINGGCTDEA